MPIWHEISVTKPQTWRTACPPPQRSRLPFPKDSIVMLDALVYPASALYHYITSWPANEMVALTIFCSSVCILASSSSTVSHATTIAAMTPYNLLRGLTLLFKTKSLLCSRFFTSGGYVTTLSHDQCISPPTRLEWQKQFAYWLPLSFYAWFIWTFIISLLRVYHPIYSLYLTYHTTKKKKKKTSFRCFAVRSACRHRPIPWLPNSPISFHLHHSHSTISALATRTSFMMCL